MEAGPLSPRLLFLPPVGEELLALGEEGGEQPGEDRPEGGVDPGDVEGGDGDCKGGERTEAERAAGRLDEGVLK